MAILPCPSSSRQKMLSSSASQQLNEIVPPFKSADQILSALGARNRFLLFVWIVMAFCWTVGALPIMASAFLMDDQCIPAGRSGENSTSPACSPEKGTVTGEFHLDEDHRFLADLSTSAFIGGMAVGSIFMPLLADRRGRRPALLFSLMLGGTAGCASALSPNIYAFIGMRFVQGLSFSGSVLVNWVLAYECIPLTLRTRTALLFGLLWVLGYCLVSPMAFLVSSWRQLIFAVSLPSLVLGLFYLFTVPESFHFLVAQRKRSAIRNWIGKANKFGGERTSPQRRIINDRELEAFLAHLLDSRNNSNNDGRDNAISSNNALAIRRSRSLTSAGFCPTLLLYLAVFIYIWTCDTFIYYGLSLFSTQLAGNRYINFTLVGLAEIPSYLIAPFLLDKLGRRLFTALMHILAAIAFLAVLANDHPQFFLVLWLLAKFAISSSFTGLFVYSSEVFPTTHRNICMGLCTTVSQASGIFAPSVKLMAKLSPLAPMIFFGSSSLLAGIVTFALPETKDKELPERPIAGEQ